jgi:hypothetical protein
MTRIGSPMAFFRWESSILRAVTIQCDLSKSSACIWPGFSFLKRNRGFQRSRIDWYRESGSDRHHNKLLNGLSNRSGPVRYELFDKSKQAFSVYYGLNSLFVSPPRSQSRGCFVSGQRSMLLASRGSADLTLFAAARVLSTSLSPVSGSATSRYHSNDAFTSDRRTHPISFSMRHRK